MKLNPTKSSRKFSIKETRRVTAKKREVNYVDKAVTERVDTYKKVLPKKLRNEATVVREFFLNEIGPFMMAINVGTDEAREVAERTIEGKVDRSVFLRFEQMVAKAVELKMSKFIAKWLDVSEEEMVAIISALNEKPTIILTPKDVPHEKLGGSIKGK